MQAVSDGDLMRVFGKANVNATERTYANSFSYTASGGIAQMRLGNGKWETAKFNNRLQVTELGLGASSVDGGTWKVNYDYGELNTDGSVDTSKNTGNIARQTLSFSGLANPFVQSYKYDSLYRLKEAKETPSGNSINNWIQNWDYDRYGNRTGFTQNIAGNTTVTNPTIDTNTNRFTIAGTNFQYDLNGNIIRDAEARQFTFNGDNKQTQVKDINNVVVGTYFYDGEGKRIKKVTNTETTVFVYSSGKLVAEYSTATPPANPTINYTTTDHLGSPRVITDGLGQVKSRRDFMPFGEELTINVGARSAALNYGSTDNVRQKFTGYIKDSETNLDFAEARMYENHFGRFTAVDPLLASGKSANPQTFNRFIYVGNNPMLRTDPTGQDWFKRYNEETKRWEYRDQKGSPGKGWNPVDFGGKDYITVGDWCWNANCSYATAYLYNGGLWDYGARANYGLGDAAADTVVGAGKWGWNGMASGSELFYGVLGRLSWEYAFTGQPREMPSVQYFEYSNQTQASAGTAMTALSFLAPAFKKPGAVSFAGFTSETSAAGVGSSAVKFEQYALRAARDGMYPVMQRGSAEPVGSIFLKEGEVWKFGQTMNPTTRYSGNFLRSNDLKFVPEFRTPSFKDVLQMERQNILQYEQQFGKLPPGNKIRR